MLTFFIAYLICGIVVGFIAGLFGIGGGIIGIPALLILFNLQNIPQAISMHMAIGTLLAVGIVMSAASVYTHHQNGTIIFLVFKKVFLGTIVGSIMGIMISNHLHSYYLQKLFGLFLTILAVQMLIKIEFNPGRQLPGRKILFLISAVIGTIGGMLGLGGGALMVPYFHWHGIPIRNAIATSSLCVLPILLIGTCGYMLFDVQFVNADVWHCGFIYWPAFFSLSMTGVLFAPIGAKVAYRISTILLKRAFSFVLITMGLGMLFH